MHIDAESSKPGAANSTSPQANSSGPVSTATPQPHASDHPAAETQAADAQAPGNATADLESQPAFVRNFVVLAAYQIVMRTGWIFKTESIIMPAVLDSVSGAGWVRGWLPLLNRFGHSVPPLLLAERLKIAPYKKRVLTTSTGLLATIFLLLSVLFSFPSWFPRSQVALAFLVLYTLFFMCIGVNQLAFNTLQGKLIPATRRGRLLLVANSLGAVTAVSCAFVLLPGWLDQERPRFDLIFGFSGALFASATITLVLLKEPRDNYARSGAQLRHYFHDAWSIWTQDTNFRLLTIVAALFGVSVMLFPHYQNLGLQGMRLELKNLMWWVVVQNVGTGLFSVPVGRLADRKGNRSVLQLTLLGIAAAPLIAILLSRSGDLGSRCFPGVFVLVGLTPVVLRTLQNFALEVSPPESHPRYLSTLALCMSVPMFFSPIVGLLIDELGFAPIFLSASSLILVGWGLTFRLREPREHGSLESTHTAE